MKSLRALPSVDQVLRNLKGSERFPQKLVVDEIRAVLNERRTALKAGTEDTSASVEKAIEDRLRRLVRPSLRRVINATGVILHTNLGRAPLGHFEPIAGYSNLEYDVRNGKRGKRDVHTGGLLERLIGKSAIVVNNNAAAVYLVLHELAAGHEVIVSRGELIEIGDGFRIPEIMAHSGAQLREIGTTNRTHIEDYRSAINDRTRLILRVHRSNFSITGFTAQPMLEDLVNLGRSAGIPVYEDLGSGCLVDLRPRGIDEPLVRDSIDAGVNIASFSCDKLLGGPQSGIIAGDAELLARIRRNPMYRAFRIDKLISEALETTLRHLLVENWNAIPTLRMILADVSEIHDRAERVARRLNGMEVAVREGESAIGGGSTADQTLPTWVIEIAAGDVMEFEQRLRTADTPVIARVERDKIVIDLRTVLEDEAELLISTVLVAAAG